MAPAKKQGGGGNGTDNEFARVPEEVPELETPEIDSVEWKQQVEVPTHTPFPPLDEWQNDLQGDKTEHHVDHSIFNDLFPETEVDWKLPSEVWPNADFVVKENPEVRTEPNWDNLFWLSHEQSDELRVSIAVEEINIRHSSEFLSLWERRNNVAPGSLLWEPISLLNKTELNAVAATAHASGKKSKKEKEGTAAPAETTTVKVEGENNFLVKLFFAGQWRSIIINNLIPVSKTTGELMLPHYQSVTKDTVAMKKLKMNISKVEGGDTPETTSPNDEVGNENDTTTVSGDAGTEGEGRADSAPEYTLELWPLLLSKAALQVFAIHSSGCCNNDPSFSLAHLTVGWAPETVANRIENTSQFYEVVCESSWSMHDLGWEAIESPKLEDFYFASWDEFEETFNQVKESGDATAIERLEKSKFEAMERRRKQWRQSRRMSHNVSMGSVVSSTSSFKISQRLSLLPLNDLAFEEAKVKTKRLIQALEDKLAAKRDRIMRIAPCTGAPPVVLLEEDTNEVDVPMTSSTKRPLVTAQQQNSALAREKSTKQVIWEDSSALSGFVETTLRHHAWWNILESRGSMHNEDQPWLVRVQGFDETTQNVTDKWVSGESVFSAIQEGSLVFECLVDINFILPTVSPTDESAEEEPKTCCSYEKHWKFEELPTTSNDGASEAKDHLGKSTKMVVQIPGSSFMTFSVARPEVAEASDESLEGEDGLDKSSNDEHETEEEEEKDSKDASDEKIEEASISEETTNEQVIDDGKVEVLFVVQADPSPQGHSRARFGVGTDCDIVSWKSVRNVFNDCSANQTHGDTFTTIIAQWSALGSASVACAVLRLEPNVPHCITFDSTVGGSVQAFAKHQVEFLDVANAFSKFFPKFVSTTQREGIVPTVPQFGWFPFLRCVITPRDQVEESEQDSLKQSSVDEEHRIFATLTTPDVRDECNISLFLVNRQDGDIKELSRTGGVATLAAPGELLRPNGGKGYSLVGMVRQAKKSRKEQNRPFTRSLKWKLAMSASFNLEESSSFVEQAQHVASYSGEYIPNKSRLLFRDVLPPLASLEHSCFSLEDIDPSLSGRFQMELRVVSCSKKHQSEGVFGKGDVVLSTSFKKDFSSTLLWVNPNQLQSEETETDSPPEDRYLVLEGYLTSLPSTQAASLLPYWDRKQLDAEQLEQIDDAEKGNTDETTEQRIPNRIQWRLRVCCAETLQLCRDTVWEEAKSSVMASWNTEVSEVDQPYFTVAATGKAADRTTVARASRLRYLGKHELASQLFDCNPFVDAPKGCSEEMAAEREERKRLLKVLDALSLEELNVLESITSKFQTIEEVQERLRNLKMLHKSGEQYIRQQQESREAAKATRESEFTNILSQLSSSHLQKHVSATEKHVKEVDNWVQGLSERFSTILEAVVETKGGKKK